MPRRDIHLGVNIAHMWASGGVAHIYLLTTSINLSGWGSEAAVAQVSNSAFYPAVTEDVYVPTRDSYSPTTLNVSTNGTVKVGYAGGSTGKRIVSSVLTYDIG